METLSHLRLPFFDDSSLCQVYIKSAITDVKRFAHKHYWNIKKYNYYKKMVASSLTIEYDIVIPSKFIMLVHNFERSKQGPQYFNGYRWQPFPN